MAYKFQVGPASMSGSLKQSGSLSVLNQLGVTQFSVAKSTGNVSGSGNLQIGGTADFDKALNCDQSITGLSFTDGTATLTAGALTGVTNITLNGTLSDGNYTFDTSGNVTGLGTVACGQVTSTGTVTAVGSFIIGSADLNEADMEKLDGITNGTAAANKALVVDANKDIGTLRNLTIDGTFSDGNYTFDTSGNVTGLGTVACGAVTSTAAVKGTNLSGSGTLTIVGTSNLKGAAVLESTLHVTGAATLGSTLGCGAVTSTGTIKGTNLSGSGALDIVGAGKFVGALTAAGTMNVSGAATLAGTVTLSGVADTAVAVAADSFYYLDATDNLVKRDTMADYATALAGTTANTGLKAASGALTLDIANVTAAAIASTDTLLFNDQTGDVVRQETIDDIATLFAGDGLVANSAVIQLDLNELASATVDVANDSLAIIDANASNGSKKESFVDLAAAMAGTGVTATNGVFSVDTTGGDSMSSVAIADGGTLAAGLNFFAAITANAAVTLPTPGAGDIIVLKAHTISDGEAITVNRSGTQTIDGLTSVELRSDYGAITFIATAAGTACDWRIA